MQVIYLHLSNMDERMGVHQQNEDRAGEKIYLEINLNKYLLIYI